MPGDPKQTKAFLDSLHTSNRARAAAFDAIHNAVDDADAQQRIDKLPFSRDLKAQMWDLRAGGTIEGEMRPPQTPRVEDAMGPQAQPPEGSAAGRFASNAWEMLNPITAVKGVYDAVTSPRDTARALVSAHAEQFRKAGDAWDRGGAGGVSEAIGHTVAGVIPFVGPAAAEAGEQIATGDVAGGLGKGFGLLAPYGTRPVAAGVRAAIPAETRAAVATRLERGASDRVADVMTPKVGRQKQRRGAKADEIAPQIAKDLGREGAPFTRDAFHGDIQTKHTSARQALDAAADERLAARTFETQPLIDDLLEKRRALTAEAVEGNRPYRAAGERGALEAVPLGEDVVPSPNAARVAVIDGAIDEIRRLGPVARYEPIRRIRQAYDSQADVVYNPSMTADFLTHKAGAQGAADVTGVLREKLAGWDPNTATANAQYSLYRNADDLLKAVAETEKTRPRVGRLIMARLTGTLFGQQAAGPAGAVAGYVGAPLLDAALASGATTQLKTAAMLQRLANAVRNGNVEQVNFWTLRLERELRGAGRVARNTAPVQTGRITERVPGQTAEAQEDTSPVVAQR